MLRFLNVYVAAKIAVMTRLKLNHIHVHVVRCKPEIGWVTHDFAHVVAQLKPGSTTNREIEKFKYNSAGRRPNGVANVAGYAIDRDIKSGLFSDNNILVTVTAVINMIISHGGYIFTAVIDMIISHGG